MRWWHFGGDVLQADDAYAPLHLDDSVHEKKGKAMREQVQHSLGFDLWRGGDDTECFSWAAPNDRVLLPPEGRSDNRRSVPSR
jgi:hypothetical protein